MRHFAMALAWMLCSIPAYAEIVTIEYTGIINHIREGSSGDLALTRAVVSSSVVPGGVTIGDTIHGRFSYDSAMTPLVTTPHYALYSGNWNTPETNAELVFDKTGTTISSSGITTAGVFNNYFVEHQDRIDFAPALSYTQPARFSFEFVDMTGEVLSDLTLPASINPDDFYKSSVDINWQDPVLDRQVYIDAMLTSFVKVSPVPEPSTYAMLFAGMAVVGSIARRRRRHLERAPASS